MLHNFWKVTGTYKWYFVSRWVQLSAPLIDGRNTQNLIATVTGKNDLIPSLSGRTGILRQWWEKSGGFSSENLLYWIRVRGFNRDGNLRVNSKVSAYVKVLHEKFQFQEVGDLRWGIWWAVGRKLVFCPSSSAADIVSFAKTNKKQSNCWCFSGCILDLESLILSPIGL